MQFEYNNKIYNFEKIDDDYLSGLESSIQTNCKYDSEGNLITREVRSDLYCVKYREKETGLIIETQAGIELDIENNDYVYSGDDIFTGCVSMNTNHNFYPEVNFDYSEFTLPDSIEDEFEFENAFESAANRQACIDLEYKIEYDKIPELAEYMSNKSETMKRCKRQRRKIR
ncbi:hypothetical protein MH171_001863 [Vibrio parahaemolyticus]|uniref:Uncharacterized protein n=1 Tax=Photobacterium damsela subsp. piscicida TaxID=38294 RepID=A0A7L8A147_PHODP|nr:hypothetical protein [Photobacterium damselae]EIW7861934.1 hypothetical protein [Vibrio parahaemolyticus]ELA7254393.1 hypothetical protein [Vibrio parahaemolyticus]EMF1839562.1 hypothetical protein [Vibrio parahaemolyticus]QOD51729.1 hypothetical protein IC628_09500 [Photobacterium damselae subsp. piscicida]QOD55584.1 hypothetical protein IC627_09530 [Photobacterium damselae subsp. piscicida]